MNNGVSVIICCYNSSERLFETLSHLKSQKTNNLNWEIIVVDNASTDDTFHVAEQMLRSSGLQYQIVKEPIPGLINARLKGETVSQYEFLLYCDDDNWLPITCRGFMIL